MGNPIYFYDKKEDTAYIVCRQCSKKNPIEGTHEYGFYAKCDCGAREKINFIP